MADAHAKPQHDYHLVDPSPWPFLGSIGALVTAIGGVCLMQYLKAGNFPIFGHNIANPWLFFIGLIIYALQVPLSRWWLSMHRYGPMEWLWRRLTYGPTSTSSVP